MFQGRTTTTVSSPEASRMNYNDLRPTFGQLAPLFGLTMITLLPMMLGGAILLLSFPKTSDASAWNTFGMIIGGLSCLAGVKLFWPLSSSVPRSVIEYYSMVREWHDAELEKYQEGDGRVVAQQVSEWSYNPLDLRSLMLAYIAVLYSQPNSLTIDSLQQHGLWIKVGTHDMFIMKFTQDTAAAFLNLMAAAGAISGRSPRQAGQVLISQPRDQIGRLLKLASKDPNVLATMQTLTQEG